MIREILAPVGSYSCLSAAIKAGADSVYFGVGHLNMRARAAYNFNLEDIKKITRICRRFNVKTYLTVNTVVYDEEISDILDVLSCAKDAGIDAIIASDIAVITLAKKLGLKVHISVQANVANTESVKFFSNYADVIVLARELSLNQIKNIITNVNKSPILGPSGNPVRIEVFVHGALCVSISGKCYMSLAKYNKSANRGECYQNCRRSYRVIDESDGFELVVEDKHVMSPKDICMIRSMDKLVDAGISIFKIEGRGRSADYVYKTVKIYKDALLSVLNNTYTEEKKEKWDSELRSVFNRDFWYGGYYLGDELQMWSKKPDNNSKFKKVRVGVINKYFNKIKVAEVNLRDGDLSLGNKILIIGKTTGVLYDVVKEIRLNDVNVDQVSKGNVISIPLQEKVRPNDEIYVLEENL